jgi:hypothetical protein
VTTITIKHPPATLPTITALATDRYLTARAKGFILAALAALPDDWQGNVSDLNRICGPGLGRRAFTDTLREATERGCLTVTDPGDGSRATWLIIAPDRIGAPL